jgi:hypothetical protein
VRLFATKVVWFRKIRLKIRFAFTTLTVNDYTKFKFRTVCKNRILKGEEYKGDFRDNKDFKDMINNKNRSKTEF